MRPFAAGIAVTLVLIAAVTQIALPSYVEGRARDRLEEGGGSAKVSISAFPAFTLLGGRGGRIEATGSGLSFDLDKRREKPFHRLDGFEEVRLDLRDLDADPLKVDRFVLTRKGRDKDYDLRVTGATTPRELASAVGSQAGGPLGGLVGSLATGIFPGGGDTEIPVKLTAAVRSKDGTAKVDVAEGSVAGIPAGPLTDIVLGTVLKRL
jgi:hypothetical protein